MGLFREDGSPATDIGDESVPTLVLGGKLFFPNGAQVGVVSPEGKHFLAPVEKAHTLFQQGWGYESDAAMADRKALESVAGPGEAAKAFGEGAASSLTLGASDLLESAMLGNAREQELRARAHPIARGAGEVISALGAAALGDEASPMGLLMKGGGALEAGLGKGAIGAVARSAAEMGVIGATGEIKQEVLHDEPLDIQKIGGAFGVDAMYGGGIGGALHTLGAVARGALGLTGIGPSAVKAGTLDAVKDALATKAEEDPTTIWGKIRDVFAGGKDRRAALGRLTSDADLRRLAYMADSDAERAVIDASDGLGDFAKKINQAAWDVKESIKRPRIIEGLGAIDPMLPRQKTFDAIEAMRAQVGRMKSSPAEFFNSPKIGLIEEQIRALEKVLGIEERVVAPLDSLGYPIPGGAPVLKRSLTGKAPTALELWDALDAARGHFDLIAKLGESVPAIERPAAAVAAKLRYSTLKDLLENREVWGSAAATQQTYNRMHATFLDAQEDFLKAFGKKVDFAGGKPVFDIDPAKLKGMTKQLGTAEGELSRGALVNYFEQAKAIGDQLASSPEIQDTLASTFKATGDVAKLAKARADLKALSSSANDAAGILGSPLGRAFLGHMVAGPLGAVVGFGANASRVPAVMHLLDQIAGARTAQMGVMARAFARGVRPVLRRTPVAALKALESVRFSDRPYDKPAGSLAEAVARRTAEIRALQSDPARRLSLARTAVSPIAADDPKVASGMIVQSERTFAWLAQQLPHEAKRGLLDMNPTPIPPSHAEQQDFAEAVRVASDPMRALEDLARGRLTVKGAEAIRACAPDLHKAAIVAVMKEVRASGRDLSYQERMQFSLFAGQPVEETLQPKFVALMQGTYAPSLPPPGSPGAPEMPKLKSTKDLHSAQAASSAMDRLEFRGQSGKDYG